MVVRLVGKERNCAVVVPERRRRRLSFFMLDAN
jgi:hypothetical protein